MTPKPASKHARWLVVLALVAGSCSAASEVTTTTTAVVTTTPTTATTTSTTTAPVSTTYAAATDAVIGEPCDVPGQFGMTSEGMPTHCSPFARDGEQLDQPYWREASIGDDLSVVLNAEQRQAVEVARETDPSLSSMSDHALIASIEEYAATMDLAAESGIPSDEAFYRLAEGLAAQNNMDDLAAVDMTLAMLLGAMLMLEPGSPGALYAADIVDWFLELGE